MSFCFNFKNPSSIENSPEDLKPQHSLLSDKKLPLSVCKYVSLENLQFKVNKHKAKSFPCGQRDIKYITEELITNETVPSFLHKLDSDLLPNQYEGGLKVWECSLDLLHFISSDDVIHSGCSVLELGCGVGLPGLFSYLNGASVTFQDFNSEVLEMITVPNVYLNTENQDSSIISSRCKFLSGDWGDILELYFSDEKEKQLFDLILTSETIYNPTNQRKLLNLLKSSLKPNGAIYLAAKVHYFGVGGGITDFEALLKDDGAFDFSTVFKTTEGVERQILKLTFKKSRS